MKELNPVWNLETFFPGGSSSAELMEEMNLLTADIQKYRDVLTASTSSTIEDWSRRIDVLQNLGSRLYQVAAFLGCLNAANIKDTKAQMHYGRFFAIYAQFEQILTLVNQQILDINENDWVAFIAQDAFAEYRFVLNDMREKAKEQLPSEQEQLISRLSTDGYNAWGTLYDRLVARIKIPLTEANGTEVLLSAGQAYNRLSDPNREVRKQLLPKWEAAWQDLAELAAHELNSMIGFRLNLYEARGWNDPLKEACSQNRIQRKTVDTMWETINKNKASLVKYLKKKKELLKADTLAWHDFGAPVGNQNSQWSYEQGAEFIVEQFNKFSPLMATFAEKAFTNRWIEAENRGDKGAGAFCTSFPIAKESRIFTTFSGTVSNVTTLAHELGHGFHDFAMKDLPLLNREIGMCLAETASTFSELVVSDAAIRNAKSEEEKLSLLESKLQRAASHMMNIHCRYIFEMNFYNARSKGPLSLDQINQMMVEAQKEAYLNTLEEWHPTFWFSKGHFHGTSVPFYNFPYTFGFLFATGIYAKALEMGSSFEDMYLELLRHTGTMTVEDLAQTYLQTDLTKPEFWQKAIDLALADLDEYLQLADKQV